MADSVEVKFFGEFEVAQAGVLVPVRGAKQRALLAVLALHRGEPLSTDRLVDALWGDGQVANPVNALQAQIGQLRRSLRATAIVTSDAGYALEEEAFGLPWRWEGVHGSKSTPPKRCCPQGATLGLTLGFANDLVVGRLNQRLPAPPANRVGQVTRAASARREVMSSFM